MRITSKLIQSGFDPMFEPRVLDSALLHFSYHCATVLRFPSTNAWKNPGTPAQRYGSTCIAVTPLPLPAGRKRTKLAVITTLCFRRLLAQLREGEGATKQRPGRSAAGSPASTNKDDVAPRQPLKSIIKMHQQYGCATAIPRYDKPVFLFTLVVMVTGGRPSAGGIQKTSI